MFKMKIVLDENRIVIDGRYTVAEVQDMLRKTLDIVEIEQKEPNMYYGKGDKHDFGRFGGAILKLEKKEWFMPYVSTWRYWGTSGEENVIEEIAKFERNRYAG